MKTNLKRCRWKGNNPDELQRFVHENGGLLDFVRTTIQPGSSQGPALVRLSAVLLPHGQVVRPGAWLERVEAFPADTERGWRCVVTTPKPVKRARNGRKPWR